MPSTFEQDIAAGLADIRAAAGQTVHYRRPVAGGPDIEAELSNVVRSKLAVQIENASGLVEYAEQWDFLVAAADVIAAGLVEPAAGDRITTDDGCAYEVASTGADKPFAESDSGGTQLRIHTKKVPA